MMNKKTKASAAILASLLAVSMFAGCTATEGGSSSTASTASTAASDTESKAESGESADLGDKVFNVGVCQLVQHEALDAATKGFQDKLTELLGEDHVKFDVQNAQGDSTNCATICNQFVSSSYDLIMANATPALQAASAATTEIPILATSITEYGTALEIQNFNGKTGINVSGTSDLAPLKDQAAMVKELCPDAKTVGIIYCSAEANSKYQVNVMTESLTELGYSVKEYTFADSNDVAQVTQTACSECDALYVPTDNTAASNAQLIDSIALPAKKPVIAGEEGICKGCGIATLSISYYDIGTKTGEMAYDILVNGAKPAEMDIAYAPKFEKKYVAARCEELGITIPDGYEAIAAE